MTCWPFKPFAKSVTLSSVKHGAILHGLSNVPIDSLKSVGHCTRRALAAAHYKHRIRGTLIATVKVWQPSSQTQQGQFDKYTSIQFVDVATVVHDDNHQHSTALIQKHNAATRKADGVLGGVLRGTLLKEAGNEATISYRDSLLTRVLQRSMDHPDARTVILAAVSPTDYEDTLTTLRYASRLIHKPGQTPQSPFETNATSPTDSTSTTTSHCLAEWATATEEATTTYMQHLVSDPRQRLARVFAAPKKEEAVMVVAEEEDPNYIPTQYAVQELDQPPVSNEMEEMRRSNMGVNNVVVSRLYQDDVESSWPQQPDHSRSEKVVVDEDGDQNSMEVQEDLFRTFSFQDDENSSSEGMQDDLCEGASNVHDGDAANREVPLSIPGEQNEEYVAHDGWQSGSDEGRHMARSAEVSRTQMESAPLPEERNSCTKFDGHPQSTRAFDERIGQQGPTGLPMQVEAATPLAQNRKPYSQFAGPLLQAPSGDTDEKEMDELSLELERQALRDRDREERDVSQEAMDDLSLELYEKTFSNRPPKAIVDPPFAETDGFVSSSPVEALPTQRDAAVRPATASATHGAATSQRTNGNDANLPHESMVEYNSTQSLRIKPESKMVEVQQVVDHSVDRDENELLMDQRYPEGRAVPSHVQMKHIHDDSRSIPDEGTDGASAHGPSPAIDELSLRQKLEDAKRSSTTIKGISPEIVILQGQASSSAVEDLRPLQDSHEVIVQDLIRQREEAWKEAENLKKQLDEMAGRNSLELQQRDEEIAELERKIETAESERSEAVRIADEAITLPETQAQRISDLEQAENDLVEELQEVQQELALYKSEIASSDQLVTDLRQQLKASEEKRQRGEGEIRRSRVDINRMRVEQTRAHRSEAELAAFEKEVERLRREASANQSASQKQEADMRQALEESRDEIHRIRQESEASLSAARSAATSRESELLREINDKREEIEHLKQESETALGRAQLASRARELELIGVVREKEEEISRLKQESKASLDSLTRERDALSDELEKTREELDKRLSVVHELTSNLKKVLSDKEWSDERAGQMEDALQTFQSDTRSKLQKMLRERREAKTLLESTLAENTALAQTIQELRESLMSLRQDRNEIFGRHEDHLVTELERENAELKESNREMKLEIQELRAQVVGTSTNEADSSLHSSRNRYDEAWYGRGGSVTRSSQVRDPVSPRSSPRRMSDNRVYEGYRDDDSDQHASPTLSREYPARHSSPRQTQRREGSDNLGYGPPRYDIGVTEHGEDTDLNVRAEEVAAYMAVSAKALMERNSSEAQRLTQQMYALEHAKDAEIEALRRRLRTLERLIDVDRLG